MEDSAMSRAKHALNQKRPRKTLPTLGIASLSLSLAGGASAATSGPAVDIPSRDIAPRHEITLSEEEFSDVTLSTFYLFDKEGAGTHQLGQQVAWGCRCGCRGCRGCRGCFRGCRGCGGCGGCGGGGCCSC